MAWNEPGGNRNDNDPWGTGGGRRGNDQGPPDLDEALKKGLDKLNRMLGGKGGNSGGGSSSGGSAGGFGAILAIAAILVVGYVIYQSFYTVDEQERAVVLRFGEYNRTENPGLRFKVPLIDTVNKVRVTSIRTAESSGQMLTQDENLVTVDLQVQYRVGDAQAYVLNVRDSNQALAFATDSALRHEVGSSSLDDVLTEGRAELAVRVEQRLQSFLREYGTGLEIVRVNVESTQPPAPVQDAFREVQRAREDEQRLKEEAETYRNKIVPEARGQAQRMIEEANAYKQEVIERARGETARFNQLLAVYEQAPVVTRERMYIQALEQVLGNSSKIFVDTESSGNMMYLPLDRLTQGSLSSSGSRMSGSSGQQVDIQTLTDQVLQELRTRQDTNTRRSR
ncbi:MULTISPECIES: FtsH protease activity modulator HflK [Marinobacter]|jgi:membrane protease subunit HflK|uniref:Protein HflK n=1 Tax=Marinobacter nauticus TaxID=2743 RepID=A0A368XSP5_MARNT|nr:MULTISPECIES: FtsH protease activity modulator HflK [Marinobacter]MEC8823108.1 FtsH protease activity modulator HflK [Pseudomonadota bacterium]KAE8544949.1 HflK protein [Marinobacter nauticus]MAC22785.1 FtsH protease activity modulator HflK [Marinobacter sp.]MBH91800.1 FtsH protease activity modulator HflK [Marinobacter sp.]MEC8898680.1 FtsH protease activity modulator HflK [Pseudomonadota bacterium]|tara:strand:+ start:1452 stop:2636 length:1185 start_codon:yes stop_codon:yes gene_type:complete